MSWTSEGVLVLVPLVWLAMRSWLRASQPRGVGSPALVHLHASARGVAAISAGRLAGSGTRSRRGVAVSTALVLALFALAGPRWGDPEEVSTAGSREVVFAVDLSRSMWATDVAPSRLARARLLVDAALEDLPGVPTALVAFAGSAYVQVPRSADREVIRRLLAELSPEQIPRQGTDYGAMLEAAGDAFGLGEATEEAPRDKGSLVQRTLVVLSDGEVGEEDWREGIAVLARRGVRVVALGIGTREGSELPRHDPEAPARDRGGQPARRAAEDAEGDVLRDATGAPIVSRLEPAPLRALADATGGVYRDAGHWVEIASLLDALPAPPGVHEAGAWREQARFQWFLAPAVLLLLLALVRELPSTPRIRTLPTHPGAGRSARIVAWGVVLGIAIVPAGPADDAPGASPDASRLVDLVAELASGPAPDASGYADLARETLAFREGLKTLPLPAAGGVVDDGLAAVARGEGLDPAAASWAALRDALEALRRMLAERAASESPLRFEPVEPSELPPPAGPLDPADGLRSRRVEGEAGEAGADGSGSGDDPEFSADADPRKQAEIEVGESAGYSGGGGKGLARDLEAASFGKLATHLVERPGSGVGSALGSASIVTQPRLAAGFALVEAVRREDTPALLFERLHPRPRSPRRGQGTGEVGW